MKAQNVGCGLEALRNVQARVCVIGSGPVGLCIATELGRRGWPVVLLESGYERPANEKNQLAFAQLVSVDRHADPTTVVNRSFGGTSWLWGGRCVPPDPVDFLKRDHIAHSEWPIGYADVAPFFEAAAEFLDCGSSVFTLDSKDSNFLSDKNGLECNKLERWCSEPIIPLRGQSLPLSLTVVTDVTVVDLHIADGQVQALTVAQGDRRESFSGAEIYILACGGLESARLLLVAQTHAPSAFGGQQGALGRFYMGHLSGHVTNIQFADPRAARRFVYRDDGRSIVRTRFSLSERLQMERALPNVAFWPTNPPLANPFHENGLLSLIFLLLSTPYIGKRLVPESIRQLQLIDRPDYLSHVRNVAAHLPKTAMEGFGLLWQRIGKRRRKPFFFVYAQDGKYPLHFHAEHIPARESRVTLSENCDVLGVPQLSIDLRFSNADAEGVSRAHVALDEALRGAESGRLSLEGAGERGTPISETILKEARDGFSQIGTTRMGARAGDGVVDSNCKVFDLSNLFVAGSSVFRTSSQANPTFPAVALALRLASFLDRQLRSACVTVTDA